MTFFFRFLLSKRKLKNCRRPIFQKRTKHLESAEYPWPHTLRANQTPEGEEDGKVSEGAEEQEHEDPCLLLELPTSILVDILSRLPFKVVCISGCVCKVLRSVIRSPDFNSLRLERADSEIFLRYESVFYTSRALYLVDLHGISDPVPSRGGFHGLTMDVTFRIFLPKRGRSDMNMMIKKRSISFGPEPSYDIVNSCNGLICLRKASMFHGCKSPCIVCNPFTGEFTYIPKPEKKGAIQDWAVVSGFGCSARNNVYKVVRLVYGASASNPFDRIAEVYSLGCDSWRTIGLAPWDTILEGSATFLNGVIHWLSEGADSIRKNSILCFVVEDEKFQSLHLPSHFLENMIDDPRKSKLTLGVLRRCLCVSGIVHLNQFQIWVLRDYPDHESWTKAFSFHFFSGTVCRPIKWLENEDLVMLCDKMSLAIYNPVSKTVRKLNVLGKSVTYQAIAHIPNFASLKDIAGAHNLVVHNDRSRWNVPSQADDTEAILLVEDKDHGMDWAFDLWC